MMLVTLQYNNTAVHGNTLANHVIVILKIKLRSFHFHIVV